MNNATKLIRDSRNRWKQAGVVPQSVPSEVTGAYGERVAARLLGAKVVSGPDIHDHDIVKHGDKFEVKASLVRPKKIRDLAGKVQDRVVYVQLEIIDGRLHATACSCYENAGKDIGRRPSRVAFLNNAATKSVRISRPIRLPWRVRSEGAK